MCSVPGYDASGLVRDLAAEQNKQITSISIGKKESFLTPTKNTEKNPKTQMFPYVSCQQVQLKDSIKLTETSTLLSNLAGEVSLWIFILSSLPSDSSVNLISCFPGG